MALDRIARWVPLRNLAEAKVVIKGIVSRDEYFFYGNKNQNCTLTLKIGKKAFRVMKIVPKINAQWEQGKAGT